MRIEIHRVSWERGFAWRKMHDPKKVSLLLWRWEIVIVFRPPSEATQFWWKEHDKRETK